MIAELTPEQRELVRHALGLTKRGASFRNFFTADPGTPESRAWHAMVATGAARRLRYGHHAHNLELFHVALPAARAALNPGESLDEEDFPQWLR